MNSRNSSKSKLKSNMKNTSAPIGELIKEFRRTKGMTQKELSDLLGYENPQFISLIENGHSKVPLSSLGQIIRALEIPERLALSSMVSAYEKDVIAHIRKAN